MFDFYMLLLCCGMLFAMYGNIVTSSVLANVDGCEVDLYEMPMLLFVFVLGMLVNRLLNVDFICRGGVIVC